MNSYLSKPDFILIEKSKKGNQKAVSCLIYRYEHVVLFKARKYSHRLSDLDDFIQEGLIALYEAINNFNQEKETSFSTFLEVCIDRKLTSYIRRQTTDKATLLNNATSIHQPSLINLLITSTSTLPEVLLLQKSNSMALQKCISESLTFQEREVIIAYLQEESLADIAKKLKIPYKSVDNAIQRSIKKLRICLRKH